MEFEQDAAPAVEPSIDAPTEAPEQEDAPRPSIRESLEKAFAADTPEDGEAPQEALGQERGPDGRFVAKEAAEQPAQEPEAVEEATPAPNMAEAPVRFSAEAKAAWAQAPEHVRGEIHRAITEMEGGLAQKDAVIEPIKPFIDMAGDPAKLADALSAYTNMENLLRQDLYSGLAALAQNLGTTPTQLGALLTGQTPGQPDPRDQQIQQLTQQVQQLSGNFQQQQEQAVLGQLEQFAAANPRFEELQSDIAAILDLGKAPDLQSAYDLAVRMNPLPPDPAPVAQTRKPTRSVIGAPSSGSNPGTSPRSTSAREALERAFSS
jgi:TolA-binding protein